MCTYVGLLRNTLKWECFDINVGGLKPRTRINIKYTINRERFTELNFHVFTVFKGTMKVFLWKTSSGGICESLAQWIFPHLQYTLRSQRYIYPTSVDELCIILKCINIQCMSYIFYTCNIYQAAIWTVYRPSSVQLNCVDVTWQLLSNSANWYIKSKPTITVHSHIIVITKCDGQLHFEVT